MNGSYVDDAPERGRCLNAVALQNAVLCAECDVVSDSPHDTCLVCGSRSLFNIARMFGGNLPQRSRGPGSVRDTGSAPRVGAELSRATIRLRLKAGRLVCIAAR